MGDNGNGGGGNAGVVAVLVMFIIVIVAAFFVYRAGLFGPKKTQVDINVTTPQKGPIRIGWNRIQVVRPVPVTCANCSRPSFRRG